MTIRTTLRQLAEEANAAERVRLSDVLASQIELALNDQSNRTQVALWGAQEEAYRKIDDLYQQVGDTNTLLAGVIEALRGIKESSDGVHRRLDEFADANAIALGSVHGRLDAKRARIEALEGRADATDDRLADLERRLRALEARGDG